MEWLSQSVFGYVLGERRTPKGRIKEVRKLKEGRSGNIADTPHHRCLLGSEPSFSRLPGREHPHHPNHL